MLVFFLCSSAFFSSAEVAFFSLNPLQLCRLSQDHPRRAQRIESILRAPTRLLSTILIGNTLVNVAISTLIYALAVHVWGARADAAAMAFSIFLLLIFGEIGPKRIAVTHAETMASLYAPILKICIYILAPLRFALEKITRKSSHLFQPRGRTLSEDEFTTVVDVSHEEGVLNQEKRAMVRGIIRLEDLRARDVMTPRVDITGIDLEDKQANLKAAIKNAKVRHILLYRKDIDHVLGFMDVRSYLLNPGSRPEEAWVHPIYIPESCPLNKLLARFLREQRRVAIVVDEYGGTAGIITRGDVTEEITGDIDDEQGVHQLLFERVGPRRWIVDGRINLEKIEEELEIAFEEEGVDRIAGWLTARLERMPKPGDRVQAGDFHFVIRQMRRHRVTLIEITLQPSADE